jgi:hypothetical protein
VKPAQADVDIIAGRILIKDKRYQTLGMDVIGLREHCLRDPGPPLFCD